jgi:hypothetical protein
VPDAAWRAAYRANTPLAHYDDWGIIAEGILDGHPADAVALKGNASEIARNYYWKGGEPPAAATVADILALQPGWSDGSWQAQSQLEWDIAQEVFTPFGNRRLLEGLLGVPARDIGEHGVDLLREIMAAGDPRLLEVPFNPRTLRYRALDTFQRGRGRLRREARRLLR